MVEERIEGKIYTAVRFRTKYIFRANENGGYNGYLKIKDDCKSISLTNSSNFSFNTDNRYKDILEADEKDKQYFEACFKYNRILPDYTNFKIKENYEYINYEY